MTARPLDRVRSLEDQRRGAQRELARIERRRHAAIVAALDDGESLTAIATAIGVTRQALTKYLDRRENHGTDA